MTATILAEHGSATPKQICERFGVSRTWIFNRLDDGSLPKIQLSPRRILIPINAVAELLASQMTCATPPAEEAETAA